MKITVGYGSQEARIHVSHVTDGDLVLQIRRPVDGARDRLDWICVPLVQVPSFENEVRAAVNGAGFPRAANDDPVGPAVQPSFDNLDRTALPAHTPA